MKILLVGGSGHVGTIVMPYLRAAEHQVSVLDLQPPADASVPFFQGALEDEALLSQALEGVQGLVYMPLVWRVGYERDSLDANYDVQVKFLHLVVQAAARQGITRIVNLSSLSVFKLPLKADLSPYTEESPKDAPDVYGFTKGLGEETCAYLGRIYKLTIVSLRLFVPLSDEEWQEYYRLGEFSDHLAASDVARAISSALTVPLEGTHVVNLSGDWNEARVSCQKALRLLSWSPLVRPTSNVLLSG